MADLLLELFSEEIPARMQVQAAKDLERLVVGALSDRGLLFEGVKAFSGPRRLTLVMSGLPVKQPDVSEELKGPKVDAPAAAVDGFLRKAGLTNDQLKIEKTPKGDVWLAVIARKGRATADVLAEILPECFAKLPWPKSMRFPGSLVRWVRPLHGIVCLFDGEVVPFEFAGVTSANTTRGHRFLSKGEITVRHFEDYEEKLEKAHVILDAERRKDVIRHEATQKAFALGFEVIEDEGLLNEVSGLAEWPVVLIGRIQDEFMDVPPEILQTSMRTHQKYFSLRDPKTGKMAPRFVVVANMIAEDGGKEIVAGNERVLRARLSDAKFFWDQDRKRTLESRVADLKNIVFHAKLGTQYERVERIEALAGEIAEKIGSGLAEGERNKLVKKAKRAARLCKADLTTGVVGEFPELQGVMGRYYALHDREDADVADAIRDHYKPVGPSDAVPTNKVSIAVALADKLDQLVGFFAIDEKPTGSGDPYALRRSALGVIRCVLDHGRHIPVGELIALGFLSGLLTGQANFRSKLNDIWGSDDGTAEQLVELLESRHWMAVFKSNGSLAYFKNSSGNVFNLTEDELGVDGVQELSNAIRTIDDIAAEIDLWIGALPFPYRDDDLSEIDGGLVKIATLLRRGRFASPWLIDTISVLQNQIMQFLADRLKVALREKGTRHDLIDAVFSLGNEDDLVRLVARVEALQSFLKTDDGANLLTAYKRAANILKAEEKKDKTTFDGEPVRELLMTEEERKLAALFSDVYPNVVEDIKNEDFVNAMFWMSRLREPVDAFFDKVTVNDNDAKLRENRLKLLSRLRATLHLVADFSKIEG